MSLENITEETKNEIISYESFEDLDLKDELLRGIYSMGFEKPSAIQQKAIKPFLENNDLIAQAQSGTGKTATFSISILQSIDEKLSSPQAIIVSHTRELAQQIYNVFTSLSQYMRIRLCKMTGGTNIGTLIDELRLGPQIIIGTPGRIIDMMNKKHFDYKKIKYLIIDEADEMLSSGFV